MALTVANTECGEELKRTVSHFPESRFYQAGITHSDKEVVITFMV
jgi:hypothetical protein